MAAPPVLYFMRCKPSARPPVAATQDSPGYMLSSAVSMSIGVGEQRRVPTGVRVRVPRGYYAEFLDVWDLAMRGLQVVNVPITPDSDGEVQVLIRNFGRHTFRVHPGLRVAEMVLMRKPEEVIIKEVSEWPEED